MPDGGYSSGGGPNITGIFIAFFLIALLIAGGAALYRVSLARRIAERSGMDVGDATRVALLNDNAVSAAYLRSGMQQRPAPPAPSSVRTIQQRLADVEQLHSEGTLTDEEYAASRQRIIGGL